MCDARGKGCLSQCALVPEVCMRRLGSVKKGTAACFPVCKLCRACSQWGALTGSACAGSELILHARAQGWGTIQYKSTADVLQDVRKVWTGYRSSYDPSDPVVCVANTPPLHGVLGCRCPLGGFFQAREQSSSCALCAAASLDMPLRSRALQQAVLPVTGRCPPRLCRGACDVLERAFNYAWMQAGLSLDVPPNSAPPPLQQQQRRVRMHAHATHAGLCALAIGK